MSESENTSDGCEAGRVPSPAELLVELIVQWRLLSIDLVALLGPMLPELVPIIMAKLQRKKRKAYPEDSVLVPGVKAQELMRRAGGPFPAIADLMDPNADYLLSFSILKHVSELILNAGPKPV